MTYLIINLLLAVCVNFRKGSTNLRPQGNMDTASSTYFPLCPPPPISIARWFFEASARLGGRPRPGETGTHFDKKRILSRVLGAKRQLLTDLLLAFSRFFSMRIFLCSIIASRIWADYVPSHPSCASMPLKPLMLLDFYANLHLTMHRMVINNINIQRGCPQVVQNKNQSFKVLSYYDFWV